MNSHQGRLFDTSPAPWELDDESHRMIARVVFAQGAEGTYDYEVPEQLRAQLRPGMRVHVPLGKSNRAVEGYCVELVARPGTARTLKPVRSVLDAQPLVSAELLGLTGWLAERYLCSWGRAIEAAVPAGVRGQAGTRQQLMLSLAPHARTAAARSRLTEGQTRVLDALARFDQPMTIDQLMRAARCASSPIQTLRKRGLIVSERRRAAMAESEPLAVARQAGVELNEDQRSAVGEITAAMAADEHRVFVLMGVTGSGKTEVYIRAIEEAIARHRQAIVLVPEISLTPQTRRRFESRFDHVAVLHSHLSDAERHTHWKRIEAGRVQVVVGARSAVFAPVPRLGLIVLDEEHDTSFKQDKVPRYHARDVARERARRAGVPLVLGSATPSLESWYPAVEGECQLLRMPRRVLERPLPDVDAIDLRLDIKRHYRRGGISRQLELAMREALAGGGQVVLLLNRRGYATHVQCPACGEVLRCRQCDVALTHHRDRHVVVCHSCDFEAVAPDRCGKCGFEGIRFQGLGTQRIEQEVRERFPEHPVARMDSDTMRKPGSHERTLDGFREGRIRILLGTQMIAKGLDFPNVTLVGVINADTALHLPNFRAAERTFQLVTQVAGRTGRGEQGGRVLVQTLSPEHPAIEFAVRHDFEGFATWELQNRRAMNYPPLGEVIRIILRGPDEGVVAEAATELGRGLKASLDVGESRPRVVGPASAPVARVRGQYRHHLLVVAADGAIARRVVRTALSAWRPPQSVEWIVDCDPQDMM